MVKRVIPVALLLLLGGCATGNFCDVSAGPHRPSKAAIKTMNQELVDSTLADNRYGVKHCGWKK